MIPVSKAAERKIQQIYNKVYESIFTPSVLRSFSEGDKTDLLRTASRLKGSKAFDEFAKKFSFELAKSGLRKTKGIWRKYFNVAKRLRYIALETTFSEFEQNLMREIALKNFEMIKSIPDEVLKLSERKYAKTLVQQVLNKSIGRGTLEAELKKHGVKNAKLIARTETAKMQSAIIETTARDAGSVAYTWRSSSDKRTRPSHRAMNKVIVFWREGMEKPYLDKMYGNAGEFPNCRCDPQPIIDTDYLTESHYKVYDYHTKTVITMTKKELIQAIEAGQLKET